MVARDKEGAYSPTCDIDLYVLENRCVNGGECGGSDSGEYCNSTKRSQGLKCLCYVNNALMLFGSQDSLFNLISANHILTHYFGPAFVQFVQYNVKFVNK